MVQAGVLEGRGGGRVGSVCLGGEGVVSLLQRLVIQRLLSARGRGGKAGHGDRLSRGLAHVARGILEGAQSAHVSQQSTKM